MQVIHSRCAGLDVHSATVVACVMITAADGTVSKEIKTFGTMTKDLLELGDWLKSYQITHAAMESTGSYWKPVYNLLEGQMELLVVNAQHISSFRTPPLAQWTVSRRAKPPSPTISA